MEQTTDDREDYDCEDRHHNTISGIHNQFLIPLSIARRRTSAPAPGVEGGNDGLHGDELVMGEAVDKEDGGGDQRKRRCGQLDRSPGCRMAKIVRWAIG